MKTTKIISRILILALLSVGLFFYFQKSDSAIEVDHPKPSQLNLSQSNYLIEKRTELAATETATTASIEPAFIPSSFEKMNPSEKIKWATFENILITKNDNDPRLDRELKILSPNFRQALFEKYDSLRSEDHNGRGLIAFLISRKMTTIEDTQFLKKIYQESPCLSLADCKTADPEDPHHSGTNQTTLVYQQLAPLYQIEKQLTENPNLLADATYRSGIIQVLVQAESFPVLVVHEKAKSIRSKFGL